MSRSKLDHALDAARRDPLDVPLRDKAGRVVAHAILDPAAVAAAFREQHMPFSEEAR